MIPVVEHRRPRGREAGADRQAVGQCFGEGSYIGFDPQVLPGEPRSGTPDSGLHVVEDQQHVALVAELAKGLQVVHLQREYATLALGGLDHDGRGLRPDHPGHGFDVVGRYLDEPWGKGLEDSLLLGLAGGGQGGERASVERVQ